MKLKSVENHDTTQWQRILIHKSGGHSLNLKEHLFSGSII